jgi:chemotaxis protein MotB
MDTRIIIKKKGGHGGHHGGAWKVAYADFVTAMMALFIVLWLMNSSKKVQEAVGGYFKDPTGTSKMVGSNMQGSGELISLTKDDMPRLKEQLENAIRKVANFDKLSKQIEMTVTAEGLRIELLESETGTFFDLGSPTPNGSGKELLTALAVEIAKLPNRASIEGHTDSRPYGSASYSNWELSVDRANAARRIMREAGMGEHQVAQVRGYADQNLRNKANSEDPANRRISLIVQYLDASKHENNEERDSQPANPSTPNGQMTPPQGDAPRP